MIAILVLASIVIGFAITVAVLPHGIVLALIAGPVVTSILVLCGAVFIARRRHDAKASEAPLVGSRRPALPGFTAVDVKDRK
jgi:hypothetical protein